MMVVVVVVVFRRKIIKAFDICKKEQTVWHTVLIHTPKTIIPKNADCQIIWQYATCRNVYNKFILQQPFNTSARNDFPHSFSLQLQVNWGIFVLFDPLRRVGLMYINVFWYIVYHSVYKQRTKRHGGAIFFNISDTIGISLSMCGSVLVQLLISREIDSFADDTDLAVLFVFFISFCDWYGNCQRFKKPATVNCQKKE